jgi:hypothetical protein
MFACAKPPNFALALPSHFLSEQKRGEGPQKLEVEMSNELGGYVLIYRRMLDHSVFRTDAEAMAFAWMVLRASWREVDVRYKERSIKLQRGQLAMSVRDMATHLERSKDWANRFLTRLVDRDMIRIDSATGVTIISINNYNAFQLDPKGQSDRTATAARQDRDTTATQNNKGNEEKEENKGKSKKADAFILPDWIDADAWSDWEEQRRQIKKPLTDQSRKLAIKVLREGVDAGWTVRQIIDHNINGGWQGMFIPKGKANAASNPMAGLSFQQARAKLVDLTYDKDMAHDRWLQDKSNQEKYEKFKALKLQVEALNEALNGKSEWRH